MERGTQSHIAWEMNVPAWDCQVRLGVPGLCSFLLVCALEHLQMELLLPSWHMVSSAQLSARNDEYFYQNVLSKEWGKKEDLSLPRYP